MPTEKHLEMIQAAITRMAGNSFQLKAWNVALTSAVIGFAAAKESHPRAAAFALAPALVFWLLDGYYLGLETAFRNLYDGAVSGTVLPYVMTPQPTVWIWIKAFFRPSVLFIHAVLVAMIFEVTLLRYSL